MIVVKNRVRNYPIDRKRLQKVIQRILNLLHYGNFSIGILLTTDRVIRCYNRDFRAQDKPTDILSFPYHSELKAGKRIKVVADEDKNLGDIIISLEYVAREAVKRNLPFNEWFDHILVHGICHLLGYDHITDPQYRAMRAKEAFLLKKIKSSL